MFQLLGATLSVCLESEPRSALGWAGALGKLSFPFTREEARRSFIPTSKVGNNFSREHSWEIKHIWAHMQNYLGKRYSRYHVLWVGSQVGALWAGQP